MTMNFHAVVSIVALLWYAGLFLILLRLSGGRDAWKVTFGLYITAKIANQFFYLMISVSTEVEAAAFWYWSFVPLSGVVWPVYLLFLRATAGRSLWTPLTGSLVALALALVIGSFFSEHLLFTGFHLDSQVGLIVPDFGPATYPLGSVVAVFFGFSLFEILRALRSAESERERKFFRYLLAGLVFLAGGLAANGSLLLRAYPIDVITNVIDASLIAVALVRYRSSDLPQVARRGLIASVSTFIVSTFFFLLFTLAMWIMGRLDVVVAVVSACLVLSIFWVSTRLGQERIQERLEKAIFPRDYKLGTMVQRISQQAVSELHLQQLSEIILDDLQSTMRLKWCGLYLTESEAFTLVASKSYGDFELGDEQLARMFEEYERQLSEREGSAKTPRTEMIRLSQEGILIVPMVARDVDVGLLVVWPRASSVKFSQLDKLTLETLANQTASAVDNARLHQDLHKELDRRRRSQEERVRMQEQMLQLQKMEALGTLASGVAHDMNNVLAAIMSIASAAHIDIRRQRKVSEEDLEHIVEASRRGRELTDALLGFARKHAIETVPLKLDEVIDSVTILLRRTIPKGIIVENRIEKGIPFIAASPTQMQTVLMNLCVNAVHAMKDRGSLALYTKSATLDTPRDVGEVTLEPGRYVLLGVEDTGRGMEEETLRRAFDPFFTTKQDSGGTGLGLSLVYGIVRTYHGAIEIKSEINEGTEIVLWFPESSQEKPRIASSEPQIPEKLSRELEILVVDDEAMVRRATKRILETHGHKVELAVNGVDALEIFNADEHHYDLIILDMMMPVMNGSETFKKLRLLDSDIPVILCSGYSEEQEGRDLLSHDNVEFVAKPFDIETLLSKVRGLVG